MVMGFIDVPPDSVASMILSTALTPFYFLSVFAIIILVLERARGEVASLKEFNERLVDGLGEGLELVDGDFTIRHANRWMSEQFGPSVGRRCYEVLTANNPQRLGCPLQRRTAMDAPARLEIAGPDDRRFLLTCSPVRQADGQIDPTVPSFAFDADQLTQVLWNIGRNGVDAMHGHGHLTLEVWRCNDEVLISVADLGPGISLDDQCRIFQPFISKKPVGTGLGLAIAQRIVPPMADASMWNPYRNTAVALRFVCHWWRVKTWRIS